ncbi:hypothetical protein GQR58_027740 [Nymphon striatum]|nr:hypothetical protein GQR58_027740 [Nymphon striatum]
MDEVRNQRRSAQGWLTRATDNSAKTVESEGDKGDDATYAVLHLRNDLQSFRTSRKRSRICMTTRYQTTDGKGRESDLKYLLNFLNKEIQRRERSDTYKDVGVPKRSTAATSGDALNLNTSFTAALQTSSSRRNRMFRSVNSHRQCRFLSTIPPNGTLSCSSRIKYRRSKMSNM